MKTVHVLFVALLLAVSARDGRSAEPRQAPANGMTRTKNVFLVTTDGLRWQEVFRGAEPALMNEKDGGVEDVPRLKQRFDRDSPTERRKALFPFIWNVLAEEGQVYGDDGDEARVTNGKYFSYPGYNELF